MHANVAAITDGFTVPVRNVGRAFEVEPLPSFPTILFTLACVKVGLHRLLAPHITCPWPAALHAQQHVV